MDVDVGGKLETCGGLLFVFLGEVLSGVHLFDFGAAGETCLGLFVGIVVLAVSVLGDL